MIFASCFGLLAIEIDPSHMVFASFMGDFADICMQNVFIKPSPIVFASFLGDFAEICT